MFFGTASSFIERISFSEVEAKREAILFLFGCSEVNSTWIITSGLANQRAPKALFTCVVYTNTNYCNVISRLYLKVAHPQVQKILRFESLEMEFPAFWASKKVFLLTNEYSFEEANVLDSSKRCTLKSPCTLDDIKLRCSSNV